MNEITEPHPLSEGWTIDVTHLELMRVLTFARSRMQIHDDSVVWVRQNGIASRRWLVGGERFWMWVDTTGGTADPAVPVAIPVPFLDEVSEIAEEFGKATIFRNADDGRFTAYFADEHLWWDSIEDHPTEWMHEDEVCFDQPVTAAVDFAAVERIVSAYNTNLGGMSHGGPGQLPPSSPCASVTVACTGRPRGPASVSPMSPGRPRPRRRGRAWSPSSQSTCSARSVHCPPWGRCA